MRRTFVLRASLLLCALVASSGNSPPTAAPVEVTYMQAAKLRKLHLVRPDLIPYPMAVEYVC